MKVLLVSNSAIYYKPDGVAASAPAEQFETLANLGGHSVTYTGAYIGGGTLEDHWNDTTGITARNEIQNGNYDLVIMNGADEPNFNTYADLLTDLAQANGADVMLYGLWAGDYQINATSDTYTNGHHAIYRNFALSHDTAYAPNAKAYHEAHARLTARYGDDGTTAENMLTADAVHPTALFGYLIANVMYRTTFHQTPPSASVWRPAGVSLTDAQLMQSVANDIMAGNAIYLDQVTGGGGGGDPMTAEVSGRWFNDANDNGVDNNEAGVAGATVKLILGGAVVATTTTAANGSYSFDGLGAGTYQVEFAKPATGFAFVTANVGTNDGVDSDVTAIQGTGAGRTANIVLAAGGTNTTTDAGTTETTVNPPGGEPPILTFSPASYSLVKSGTGGAETVAGSAGNDYLTALGGNDRINAVAGNDYLDGGTGKDSLYGGQGADVFVFDAGDGIINGGTEIDRVLFRTGGVQDARTVTFASTEIYDLANGLVDDITLTYTQMRQGTNAELRVVAESTDTVRIDTTQTAVYLGSVTEGGQVYDRYKLGAATFGIDADVDLYVGGTLI